MAIKELKINTVFLRGFYNEAEESPPPLMLIGDEAQLTLKKGGEFADWFSDQTPVKAENGMNEIIPIGEKHRRVIHEMLDAWLDGVEFEG